jgi:ferritin
MLQKKMLVALNEQINWEFYSAYLYLAMSARFHALNMPGGANWMNVQFREELDHALRFFNYVTGRGGEVKLAAIGEPPHDWQNGVEMFEVALDHEQTVTKRIDNLADLALQLKDHASHQMLQWFIAEQVEEEASAELLLGKFRLGQESPGALFQIDTEMAARVYTPPPPPTP